MLYLYNIPFLGIRLFSSKISFVQLTRMTSVIFFYIPGLFFVSYVTGIESGVSLYSGLLHVSTVSMAIWFFISVVGGPRITF